MSRERERGKGRRGERNEGREKGGRKKKGKEKKENTFDSISHIENFQSRTIINNPNLRKVFHQQRKQHSMQFSSLFSSPSHSLSLGFFSVGRRKGERREGGKGGKEKKKGEGKKGRRRKLVKVSFFSLFPCFSLPLSFPFFPLLSPFFYLEKF